MFSMASDVVELTPSTFETLVLQSHDLWIIDFYAPWCGFCKSLVPELTKTASAFKGIVKVGALNADKYLGISKRYGITSYPTIKVFGYYKNHPEDYQGERMFKSFATLAITTVKRKVHAQFEEYQFKSAAGPNIVVLNDSNFDSLVIGSKTLWFIKFYAPWSNHSKAFLPLWRKTADKMKEDAKFGIIDGSLHSAKVQEFQIEGYPTLKAFSPYKIEPLDYYGRRDPKSVIEWVLDIIESTQDAREKKVPVKLESQREGNEYYHRDNHDDEL